MSTNAPDAVERSARGRVPQSRPHRPDLRTTAAVIDAVLIGVSPDLGCEAVSAVADCAVSATEAACRSRHHLLPFEEYAAVWGAL